MRHLKALLIKGVIMVVVGLFLVFGMEADSVLVGVLPLILVIGFLSYVTGDLLILPKTNNFIATLSDFALAFLAVWIAASWFIGVDGSPLVAAFLTSLIMAGAEYVFHIYLESRLLPLRVSGKPNL